MGDQRPGKVTAVEEGRTVAWKMINAKQKTTAAMRARGETLAK